MRTLALGAARPPCCRGRGLPAVAQDSIFVPLLTYRTGPFAGSGIPIADGMRDYLACSTSATAASAASRS
jgi:branched-chain amino acid transport system substrate-binding protein